MWLPRDCKEEAEYPKWRGVGARELKAMLSRHVGLSVGGRLSSDRVTAGKQCQAALPIKRAIDETSFQQISGWAG